MSIIINMSETYEGSGLLKFDNIGKDLSIYLSIYIMGVSEQKNYGKKSWFTIVIRSISVIRNQCQKKQNLIRVTVTEFLAKMHNACAFGTFSHIITYCSVTITQIKFYFFCVDSVVPMHLI